MGERVEAPPTKLLSKCVAPTLKAVLRIQQEHWAVLRGQDDAFDKFFADHAQKGEPERKSKRQRSSSTMTKDYEDVEMAALANATAGAGKQYRALMSMVAASDKGKHGNYYDRPSRRDELA